MQIEVRNRRKREDLNVVISYGFLDRYAPAIGLDAVAWLAVLETLQRRDVGEGWQDAPVRGMGIKDLAARYRVGDKRITALNQLLVDWELLDLEREAHGKYVYWLLSPVEDDEEFERLAARVRARCGGRRGGITERRPRDGFHAFEAVSPVGSKGLHAVQDGASRQNRQINDSNEFCQNRRNNDSDDFRTFQGEAHRTDKPSEALSVKDFIQNRRNDDSNEFCQNRRNGDSPPPTPPSSPIHENIKNYYRAEGAQVLDADPGEAPAAPAVVVSVSTFEIEKIQSCYRQVSGLDNLRSSLVRKLLKKHGPDYVQEKLDLWGSWFKEKLASGESVDPLRTLLDAVQYDWAPSGTVRRNLAEEERRRTEELLQRIEDARREAAPPEVRARYLAEIRETLRGRRAAGKNNEALDADRPGPQHQKPPASYFTRNKQEVSRMGDGEGEVGQGWPRDGP